MKIIAGVDEVGRGSLIGPVYAAAVILNKSINKDLLIDLFKITAAAYTGPIKLPLPTSSTPAIIFIISQYLNL